MVRALILASLLLACQARAQFTRQGLDVDLIRRDVALRMHLSEAAQRERNRGWLLPVLLVAGAGLITVGAVFPEDLGGLTLPLGTHALVRGTVALAFTDDPRELPLTYAAIATLPERVQYGEGRLARLARQHRRNRILDGVLGIVLAASSVPLRIGFARLDDPSYRFGDSYIDYVLVTLAALGATQGVLTFFDQTPAEAVWAHYQRLSEPRQPLSRTVFQARLRF
jgi:hypothetical protein